MDTYSESDEMIYTTVNIITSRSREISRNDIISATLSFSFCSRTGNDGNGMYSGRG